jgi:hypothetical protein
MKKLLFFALFISVGMNAYAQTDLLPHLLKLQGNWVGLTGREEWTKVEDEMVIEGISFYNVNFEEYGTNELPNEHSVIVYDNDHWVYIATPLEADKSTIFVCTKASSTEWIFENPQHDFPKRIIYRFLSEEQLETTIDAGLGSDPKDVKVWKYWKKKI